MAKRKDLSNIILRFDFIYYLRIFKIINKYLIYNFKI